MGMHVAEAYRRRRTRRELPHLPIWVAYPITISIPSAVVLCLFRIAINTNGTMEVLTGNLEALVLAAFFATGLFGGFFETINKS